MDENKVKELIAQLRKEAKTCIIITKDSSGRSLGAVKGSTIDVFNSVLAVVDTVMRKDPHVPLVTGLRLIAERIEHDKKSPRRRQPT